MPDRIDKNHPAMQKEIHARVDEALRSRGIDLSDPVRAELLSRADISYGYRDQPLLRFRAADRVFPSAGDCLDRAAISLAVFAADAYDRPSATPFVPPSCDSASGTTKHACRSRGNSYG